jgi:hypothetical protein
MPSRMATLVVTPGETTPEGAVMMPGEVMMPEGKTPGAVMTVRPATATATATETVMMEGIREGTK